MSRTDRVLKNLRRHTIFEILVQLNEFKQRLSVKIDQGSRIGCTCAVSLALDTFSSLFVLFLNYPFVHLP